MTTKNEVKARFQHFIRPIPNTEFAGFSEDGKCAVYRDQSNGRDTKFCVEHDTLDDWSMLWQRTSQGIIPQPQVVVKTASDVLKEETVRGRMMGLAAEGADKRARAIVDRLRKKIPQNVIHLQIS